MKQARWLSLFVLLALGFANAWASYPDRPITLVVPFSAGGPSDRLARDLAEALRAPLGVPVIIENVGGAGGMVGNLRVARARNDGYTILLAHLSLATVPSLYRKVPYDTLNDFEYLGLFSEVPMVLLGRKDLPAKNVGELVRWLAAQSQGANLANGGVGSASHMCGLMLQEKLALKMTTVPYKGTGPAMQDLLSGQVDLMCEQSSTAEPQVVAGTVKAFAVSTRDRVDSKALKALPTLNESGFPGFDVSVWQGLYAPKGTPPAVISRLNAALMQAISDPKFIRSQQITGAEIIHDKRNNPDEHKKFVQAEIIKWGAVIKAAGAYAD